MRPVRAAVRAPGTSRLSLGLPGPAELAGAEPRPGAVAAAGECVLIGGENEKKVGCSDSQRIGSADVRAGRGGGASLKGHALELQEEAVTCLPVFSREFPSHADVTISFQTQRS